MLAALSLIPGLDDIARPGDPARNADAIRQIADLFIAGAPRLRPEHIDLFDGIFTRLAPQASTATRVELAERMSLVANAPPTLVRGLIADEDIAIAAPLLSRAIIDTATLVDLARRKSQPHLLAIAGRTLLQSDVTDVLVRRGDRDVARRVAGNAGAEFSHAGFSALIRRSSDDGVLALAVGQRDDLSDPLLRDLLAGTVDIVRRRLFDTVTPLRKAAINQAMQEIGGKPKRAAIRRDFAAAQRAIIALHRSGGLDESAVLGFAKTHDYEKAVAALSAMTGVRIPTLDHLIMGDRHDPILILGKSIGLEWTTVRSLILMRLGPARQPASSDIEDARLNFERLVPSTAQRVLTFWQARPATAEA